MPFWWVALGIVTLRGVSGSCLFVEKFVFCVVSDDGL